MSLYDDIAQFSPVPIVDLKNLNIPRNGMVMPVSETCKRNFGKNDNCRAHYRALAEGNPEGRVLTQCPYGFSSIAFWLGGVSAAITGFVPNPRLGGSQERIVAKRHKNTRVSAEAAREMISNFRAVAARYRAIEEAAAERLKSADEEATQRLHDVEVEIAKKHSMALHEIRKLNRTVVQTAERLCMEESPQNPEQADARIVTIWKTAELMSKQFDVVDILANETLTKLPVKAPSQVYKIFDKCVRVYQAVRGSRRLFLQAPQNFSPKILVCEKTFPIIPTVLISNALKYSAPNTEVRVTLEPSERGCLASVISESPGEQLLDDSIFDLGVRVSRDSDGSGTGLYVAQLVARQHGTRITVESTPSSEHTVRHVFKVSFRTLK